MGGRPYVVSYNVPTRAASREGEQTFFQEAENIIFSLPIRERHVLLGNFNAQVHSIEIIGDQWDNLKGPHECVSEWFHEPLKSGTKCLYTVPTLYCE